MFYEREKNKMVPVSKGTTLKEVIDRGNQVFVVHFRYKRDLKQYSDGKLFPKPSPLNYLVRIR